MRYGLGASPLAASLCISASILGLGCGVDPNEPYCYPEKPKVPETRGGHPTGYAFCGTPFDACVPRTVSVVPISDGCGVFVSANGFDDKDGTKDNPVKTIKMALERLKKRPPVAEGVNASIYLCAETFTEEVQLPEGVRVYGGLDCNANVDRWIYRPPSSALETVLTAEEGKVPLRLLPGDAPTTIEDVHVVAKSVENGFGISSIAVIVEDAVATFRRCTLEAGDGSPGKPGEPSKYPVMAGLPGSAGIHACTEGSQVETEGPERTCIVGEVSRGGYGGNGGGTFGNEGGNGAPGNLMNQGFGEGLNMTMCTSGTMGAAGSPGLDGTNATGIGRLDATVGYVGVNGNAGNPGTPGGGGGGGGGAKSSGKCTMLHSGKVGASGGSGGTGGCGGLGGGGGGYGGSSIGVVSLESTLTFEGTTIVVQNGGVPGDGALGQVGGIGGVGGLKGLKGMVLVNNACDGGPGGKGGDGGKGGRGIGGHVIGVAYTKHPPTMDEQSGVRRDGEEGDVSALNVAEHEFTP